MTCLLAQGKVSKAAITTTSSGPPLTIAVASNFQFPLSTLIEESEYWSAQNIRIVVGSSGTLYAQLSKGAPFDLFFSADSERPSHLEKMNVASGRQSYARGKLILFPASNETTKDIQQNNMLNVVGKLAIANPKLAPFGKAAFEYIDSLANADYLKKQLVLGANATQAFQFVDSGNAKAGLLAESVLIYAQKNLQDSKYRNYFVIPSELYTPIFQQVVIANTSQHKAHAQKFIDFVVSSNSQNRLYGLGYLPLPEGSLAEAEGSLAEAKGSLPVAEGSK
jgi:molybdenum ABC transporter molybdate-binding protein